MSTASTGLLLAATDLQVGESRVSLGFTKSNELLVGRFAMIGVATSVIGGAGPTAAHATQAWVAQTLIGLRSDPLGVGISLSGPLGPFVRQHSFTGL